MANRKSNRKRTYRKKTMRGGTFNVPIRSFYPQNTFEHDPSRVVGGKRKNHSRKYLKSSKKMLSGGNNGFFSTFGTSSGSQTMANQITGSGPLPVNHNSYKV
jgi:hypothetical protein